MKQKNVFENIFSMRNILIQVNECNLKLFTLMVKGLWNLNVILASYWDICIHHET